MDVQIKETGVREIAGIRCFYATLSVTDLMDKHLTVNYAADDLDVIAYQNGIPLDMADSHEAEQPEGYEYEEYEGMYIGRAQFAAMIPNDPFEFTMIWELNTDSPVELVLVDLVDRNQSYKEEDSHPLAAVVTPVK